MPSEEQNKRERGRRSERACVPWCFLQKSVLKAYESEFIPRGCPNSELSNFFYGSGTNASNTLEMSPDLLQFLEFVVV
jgi:hypothetical protein